MLTVGRGGQYPTLAAAVAAAGSGDTIEVEAGTYYNDFVTIDTDLNLVAVGGMVNEVATVPPPNLKALLTESGDVSVTGFEFSGVAIPSSDGGNGAGIRYQGGELTLKDDYFHNNQDGLLGAPDPTGTMLVEDTEFADNGSGSGYTHNIYVGAIQSVVFQNCYFTGAVVGHEIKSRAANTTVENSRIQDGPTGTASYSIDTPNGGNVTIKGNVIEKGPNSQNPVLITTGEEGNLYSSSTLLVEDNTIISDLQGTAPLAVRNDTPAQATIAGNSFYGITAGQIVEGPAVVTGSVFLTTAPILNTEPPYPASY